MGDYMKLFKSDRLNPKELPVLSPSSINLFIQDKALWVLKHFFGQYGEFNIYAMRGVGIEEGLNLYYQTGDKQQGIDYAIDYFTEKSFGWGDLELLESIEAKIPEWIENCIKSIEKEFKGEVPELQKGIETELEGFKITGLVDYSFTKEDTDLKTLNTLPKIVSRGPRKGFLEAGKKANVRQQAIYNQATGKRTSLLFVTPEEHLRHILDNEEELKEGLDSAREACQEIKKILDMDYETMLEYTVPNWKSINYSFFWDEKLRDFAHDVWFFYQED